MMLNKSIIKTLVLSLLYLGNIFLMQYIVDGQSELAHYNLILDWVVYVEYYTGANIFHVK